MQNDSSKATIPRRRRTLVRELEPEIVWHPVDRIASGKYSAYCRSAKTYFDHNFKRWVCAVQFDVLDETDMHTIAKLTWYLNLGNHEKPKANRRSNYFAAWVKANGGPPKRTDRLSPNVFIRRHATVVVRSTGKDYRQTTLTQDEGYSVIETVESWNTGSRAQ